MDKNIIGLSRDLIIHPGETLSEVLSDRGMTQKELADRVGCTPQTISNIILGKKGISTSLAKKLGYVLGIDSRFWINLQSNYEQELANFEEIENITDEEFGVVRRLKQIIEFAVSSGIFVANNPVEQIIEMRKLLNVGNLTLIPKLAFSGRYRTADQSIDIYVLFAWQRICEILVSSVKIEKSLDTNLLEKCIPDIKEVMFHPVENMCDDLKIIFADCGIAFDIVRNFKGAPVQGFIKKRDDGTIVMCLTIRGKFADQFWFSLFHEIAHIINGDYDNCKIDFLEVKDEIEKVADSWAAEILIPQKDYDMFISNGNFDLESIRRFSKEQRIKPYILIGRLQKDRHLAYNQYSQEKVRYEWIEE